MRIIPVDIPKNTVTSVTFTAAASNVEVKFKGGGPILYTNNLAAGKTGAALYGGGAPPVSDFTQIPQKDGIGTISGMRPLNFFTLQGTISRMDFYSPDSASKVELIVN